MYEFAYYVLYCIHAAAKFDILFFLGEKER